MQPRFYESPVDPAKDHRAEERLVSRYERLKRALVDVVLAKTASLEVANLVAPGSIKRFGDG